MSSEVEGGHEVSQIDLDPKRGTKHSCRADRRWSGESQSLRTGDGGAGRERSSCVASARERSIGLERERDSPVSRLPQHAAESTAFSPLVPNKRRANPTSLRWPAATTRTGSTCRFFNSLRGAVMKVEMYKELVERADAILCSAALRDRPESVAVEIRFEPEWGESRSHRREGSEASWSQSTSARSFMKSKKTAKRDKEVDTPRSKTLAVSFRISPLRTRSTPCSLRSCRICSAHLDRAPRMRGISYRAAPHVFPIAQSATTDTHHRLTRSRSRLSWYASPLHKILAQPVGVQQNTIRFSFRRQNSFPLRYHLVGSEIPEPLTSNV